jgi:hypothetical protein
MLSWRSVCALALALVLALPGTALGQNAGDQQYTDPLAPGNSQGGGGGSSGTPSGGGTQGSAGSAQAQEPAAAEPAQGGGSSDLPRTGLPAGVLALAGAAMFGAGAALRRRVA